MFGPLPNVSIPIETWKASTIMEIKKEIEKLSRTTAKFVPINWNNSNLSIW